MLQQDFYHYYLRETIAEMRACNKKQSKGEEICDRIATTINRELADAKNKTWHAHPVGS